MAVTKEPFVGFSYNGKHSSELGIKRVSDGSRFNENLLPTIQDKTVQVPGGDGTYYFGSYYTQRQFTVSFAFDNLTEEQVVNLKRHFGDKGVHDLVFDESPYKVYSAKVTGTATIKHIPFDEGATNRVYKGEGSIQFTCYYPFARSKHKFLNSYSASAYPNKNEWSAASGMLANNTSKYYDTYKTGESKFNVYNPGDVDAHFKLSLYASGYGTSGYIPKGGITNEAGKNLSWDKITLESGDTYVIIDTKLNLICGAHSDPPVMTGHVYNQYISDGEFFTIPKGESYITVDTAAEKATLPKIEYDYLYF